MIGSITSTQPMIPMGNTQSSTYSLSDSQLETIQSTLSKYDSNSLTSEDAQEIVQVFQDAGIRPSGALASAMKNEGFDAKEVGDLAGVSNSNNGQMPPPPSAMQRADEENSISSQLDQLLNFNDQDSTSSNSLDQILDYTYKIINLNEDSKTEVINMFDEFSSGNSNFSSQEKSNIITNSLSQILSDPDNYNRVSFYA